MSLAPVPRSRLEPPTNPEGRRAFSQPNALPPHLTEPPDDLKPPSDSDDSDAGDERGVAANNNHGENQPSAPTEPTHQHLEEARGRLEGHKLCSQIIQSATTRIRAESVLKPDGSNLGQWCKNLRELGREHLSDPNFFFKPCDNSILEKIGRAILLATLPGPLTYKFQDFPTAYGMYKAARGKFNNISRAAQMNVWKRFVGFKLDDSMSTVGVSVKLKEWWWECSNMHVDISRDTFLAFCRPKRTTTRITPQRGSQPLNRAPTT